MAIARSHAPRISLSHFKSRNQWPAVILACMTCYWVGFLARCAAEQLERYLQSGYTFRFFDFWCLYGQRVGSLADWFGVVAPLEVVLLFAARRKGLSLGRAAAFGAAIAYIQLLLVAFTYVHGHYELGWFQLVKLTTLGVSIPAGLVAVPLLQKAKVLPAFA